MNSFSRKGSHPNTPPNSKNYSQVFIICRGSIRGKEFINRHNRPSLPRSGRNCFINWISSMNDILCYPMLSWWLRYQWKDSCWSLKSERSPWLGNAPSSPKPQNVELPSVDSLWKPCFVQVYNCIGLYQGMHLSDRYRLWDRVRLDPHTVPDLLWILWDGPTPSHPSLHYPISLPESIRPIGGSTLSRVLLLKSWK